MNIQRVLAAANTIAQYLHGNPGISLDQALANYVEPLTNAVLTDEECEEVSARVTSDLRFREQRDHAEVEDPAVVLNPDPETHQAWYEEWRTLNPEASWYWPRLENFISNELREKFGDVAAGRIVRSMDRSSGSIVRLLEDPRRVEFSTKGLVVGYVQSGKTANFTALIAKAVDAGYRLIVVLTGTHEILRRQTQQRLDRELTGEVEVDDVTHVDLPLREYRRFVRLTQRDFDFRAQGHSSLETYALYRNPVLAVMKKNCSVMRRFLSWVQRAPEEVRRSIPVLVIDDEADLASIDTNAGRNVDPTQTNALIRSVLGCFPRNAYVGYTATPFANILIDCGTRDARYGTDLYPRNFIVSLPRPEGYFGAEQVFHRADPNPFVRYVMPVEVQQVSPRGRRPIVLTSIPRRLSRALGSFIVAGAARIKRGHVNKPMTMLVHTSMQQSAHRRLKDLLDTEVASIRARLDDPYERVRLIAWLRRIWEHDFLPTSRRVHTEFGCPLDEFEDIEPYIHDFLGQLQLFELNSSSFDELDYTATPNIKALAVGGNKLSRGLTLEGLMISYYLRRSTDYDTLLQMGRWFGYRHGFEDLTRVFTSHELADWFEDLATVELELRDDIKHYEDEGLTPTEMAVRIRAHRTMRVTAPRKMGAGRQVQGSFSGRLVQTIWFPLGDRPALEANIASTEAFIRQLPLRQREPGWLATGVSGQQVLDFLDQYQYVEPRADGTGPALSLGDLKAYIRRQIASNELLSWNVALKSQTARGRSSQPITLGGLSVRPVVRSRHAGTEYKVGVISDPPDLESDLNGTDRRTRRDPLLVIYPISKDSAPRNADDRRLEPLFSGLTHRETVIGLAIDFPRSNSEPFGYVGQELP